MAGLDPASYRAGRLQRLHPVKPGDDGLKKTPRSKQKWLPKT